MAALVANTDNSLPARKDKYGHPVPNVCHVELGEDVVGGKAVFVIGDVHGCLYELRNIIKAAENMEDRVLFIFVGDLVNRGPYSMEVLQLLQSGVIECYSVRGNHEEMVMREYRRMKANPNYVLESMYQWIKDMTSDDFEFLTRLPYTISIPSLKAIVVHAGLVPGVPLDKQSYVAMPRMRNIIKDGGGFQFSSNTHRGVPWSTLWPGPDHVYFGHDARRGFQQTAFATCLDTGCHFRHKLTGMFLNGCQKIVSV